VSAFFVQFMKEGEGMVSVYHTLFNIITGLKEMEEDQFEQISDKLQKGFYQFVHFMGSGIFKGSNGIYYSVSLKPDTMIRIGKTHTKYANPTKLLLQQGITELIPIGYSSEKEQDEMIRKVYRMRRLILAYNFHTKYPYLLHLNNKLRKYVTFITSKGTWDEFDERVNHYEQLELDI